MPGEYASLDQYGRVGRQVWHKGSTWDPDTLPARIDTAYHYDVNSDITQRYDAREGASLAGRGDAYAYDGLHRLTGATRGKPDGSGGWTADGTRGEEWDLDVFGNWNSYDNSISTSFSQTRQHNQANELTRITQGTDDLDSTYDAAGNLRTRMVASDLRWVYTWDAWNRLIAVDIEELDGAWQPLAPRLQSSYYGLNQRAWSRLDAGAAGYANNGVPTNQLDRMELFYYDASWRLLERRTDESWPGSGFTHDSTSQWVWGHRYIDELVAFIDDADANDEFEDRVYAMTDRSFSVIGLENGERVRYDAYGHAQASPFADADGDGLVGLAELNLVLGAFGESIGDSGYKVEADFNADGVINLADLNIQSAQSGQSIARGRLSGSGNIVGYAGYIFEPATQMYVVRHRWYSTENGRWLSRDPLGYVDGTNVYQYVTSSPGRYMDPSGLCLTKCDCMIGSCDIDIGGFDADNVMFMLTFLGAGGSEIHFPLAVLSQFPGPRTITPNGRRDNRILEALIATYLTHEFSKWVAGETAMAVVMKAIKMRTGVAAGLATGNKALHEFQDIAMDIKGKVTARYRKCMDTECDQSDGRRQDGAWGNWTQTSINFSSRVSLNDGVDRGGFVDASLILDPKKRKQLENIIFGLINQMHKENIIGANGSVNLDSLRQSIFRPGSNYTIDGKDCRIGYSKNENNDPYATTPIFGGDSKNPFGIIP